MTSVRGIRRQQVERKTLSVQVKSETDAYLSVEAHWAFLP
jgi:hypothetical protein